MTTKRKLQVMSMTTASAERVRALLLEADAAAEGGLRLGVKSGGCAGMEYTMEIVPQAIAGDDVVEQDGARLFVDPSAVLFLIGTQLDYEVTKLRSGFVFRNPNELSACGCGESVSLTKADLAALDAS